MVPVRTKLKLQVPVVSTYDEQLDDFVVPQRRARPGRALGRRVSMPGRVNPDLEPCVAQRRVDDDDLIDSAGVTLPSAVDFEAHAA